MRSASHGHLTLVVPGLFGPPMEVGTGGLDAARALTEGLHLDTLERLLSRSTAPLPEARAMGLEALLFSCFGVSREHGDWPAAAVTYAVDGGMPGDDWLLRTDPVSLRATMADLTLMHGEALRISESESRALAAELNDHFQDAAWRLEPLAPHRWYVRASDPPRLRTWTPSELGAEPVGDRLPTGEDAGHWRGVMNEAQMVLHGSPVNREREQRGLAPVNGLWPWGGGRSPRVRGGYWDRVWSDDALVAGLASLADARHDALPDDTDRWLAELAPPGRYLLALTHGFAPARHAHLEAWRDFLAELESRWLGPVATALAHGRLGELRIRTDLGPERVLTPGRLRRWWRPARPFARAMIAAHDGT